MSHVTIGSRVSVSDKGIGTVRWIGKLEGLESMRAGVELDIGHEGCHPGEYLGQQVFACNTPKTGVFVKLTKLQAGVDLMTAIQSKYASTSCPPPVGADPLTKVTKSVKVRQKDFTPELVGEDKAAKYFTTNLFHLSELALDGVDVACVGDLSGEKFDRVERLSLRNNLIADVGEISLILSSFPTIRTLDLSGNRFIPACTSAVAPIHSNLKSLILNGCGIDCTSEIGTRILANLPSLKELRLDDNPDVFTVLQFVPKTLQQLSLRSVKNLDWKKTLHVLEQFDSLESVDVSNNTSLGQIVFGRVEAKSFPNLISLALDNCGIDDWETLTQLNTLFPSLRRLRLSENSVYSGTPKHRQLVIAIFPHVDQFNGAPVSDKARADAERYCASLIEKQDACVCAALSSERKCLLVEKFSTSGGTGGDGVLVDGGAEEQKNVRTNSLRLTITGGEKKVAVRVPLTCRISELRNIVCKKISWPLKSSLMSLHASPGEAGCCERICLDNQEAHDVSDIGLTDGWVVHVSVADD